MNLRNFKNDTLDYIEDIIIDFLGIKKPETIIEDDGIEGVLTVITVGNDDCYVILEDMDISDIIKDYPQLDKFKNTISFFLQKNLHEGSTNLDLNGLSVEIE